MTKADDGGHAFPTGATTYGSKPGMSLRDWYAGKALEGMLAHATRYKPRKGAPSNWHDAISQEAYEIADAMIKAKEGE